MNWDKIYDKSPLFIQNLMISGYGYKWKSRRFGGVFLEQVQAFKLREYYSAEQWREYQETQLRKLLMHCNETVPYYQDLFKNIGLTKQDILVFKLEDLNKIPPLEKEDFRKLPSS